MNCYKKNMFGVVFGSFSGIAWAIDTIIVGIILSLTNLYTQQELVVLPLIIAFLKDSFSCILLNSYMIKKNRLIYLIKCILNGKVHILILASILGGPIGMTLYILSIKYITPECAANISAIYPIVTAILACLIIKEKLTLKNKLGIFFSFLGIFIVGYSKMKYSFEADFYVGLVLIICTVLCWSLESILYSLQINKFSELTSNEALAIRQIISMLVHVFIIFFILYRDINITNIILNIYPIVFSTSCVSLISYLLWYKSINLIGATKATTLNVTYILWVVIFQIIIFNIKIKINFIVGSIIILMGSIFMMNYKE